MTAPFTTPLQASSLTPPVDRFSYRGYEHRLVYDAEQSRWKCLFSEPAFWGGLTSWGWEYHTDRDALIALVKQRVDAALDCVGIADRAEWERKSSAGELTREAWVDEGVVV